MYNLRGTNISIQIPYLIPYVCIYIYLISKALLIIKKRHKTVNSGVWVKSRIQKELELYTFLSI